MSGAGDEEVARGGAEQPGAQAAPSDVGAVPTWDWRSGTSFGTGTPTTSWAPQPLAWDAPAPEPAASVAVPFEAVPFAVTEPAPEPAPALAPAADGEEPAWHRAGRVEPRARLTSMPRTIVHARRALWAAMGLAGVGVAFTIGTQLYVAAVIDVAPSSADVVRSLGGAAIYVGIAAASAAAAKRRRSAAIAAAGILAFVSFTAMGVLTILPAFAAVTALVLLLLPPSRAWLTIHPERFRRLMGG